MDTFLTVFITVFLLLFLVIPFVCFCVRIQSEKLLKLCNGGNRRCQRFNLNGNRRWRAETNGEAARVRAIVSQQQNRQGNIFTISDDSSVNGTSNRYADFFYLEPTSADTARIRSQLEKDDKELPSYDEVMGLSTANTPAATANIAEPPLTVPPYSVVDPNTMAVINIPPTEHADVGGGVGVGGVITGAASTSRAAVASTSTVLALPNSVSNTSV